MKKYKENAVCPKCGGGYIRVGFTTAMEVSGYMLRTCGRCGYHWQELPLDSEEKENNK